jgi:hypothetical protein
MPMVIFMNYSKTKVRLAEKSKTIDMTVISWGRTALSRMIPYFS